MPGRPKTPTSTYSAPRFSANSKKSTLKGAFPIVSYETFSNRNRAETNPLYRSKTSSQKNIPNKPLPDRQKIDRVTDRDFLGTFLRAKVKIENPRNDLVNKLL